MLPTIDTDIEPWKRLEKTLLPSDGKTSAFVDFKILIRRKISFSSKYVHVLAI